MDRIPSQRVQDLKVVIDIMYQTSVEIIRTKQDAMRSADPLVAAEMQNKKDIISILSASFTNGSSFFLNNKSGPDVVRANATASEEDRLTDSEVIGQVGWMNLSELLYWFLFRFRTSKNLDHNFWF